MNILLIVPPNITYDSFKHPPKNSKTWRHNNGKDYGVLITDVPLGVLTISSLLKNKFNSNVEVIDFNTLIHKTWNHDNDPTFENYFDETLSNLKDSGFIPDVIGISSLFVTGYQNLIFLGERIKSIFSNAFLIVGGNVATTMYKELYSDTNNIFNALCYGEGENALLELMTANNMQEYCDASSSWITQKNLLSNSIYAHNFIQNLDEIPYLDYDCIDLNDYHHNPTIKAYTSINDKSKYFTYMGSRGCPFLCTFCSAHTVHGRKMRSFSIARIESEISHLTNKFNVNTLVIEDDMFLWDIDWATNVLKIAQKNNLTCFFPNALALYALDITMLKELYNTGVRQITLAVESGSARVLRELMKKPLKLSITERVVKDCASLGIYTDCNIIIGMPGETREDIEETRVFLKGLNANWYRINVATPLAGSEMFIKAKANNQIIGDIRFAGYKKCVVETTHFSPGEVDKIAYSLNLEMNFLNNTDIKNGNYERALESFKNVVLLREDHALAYYNIIICKLALNLNNIQFEIDKINEILTLDIFWHNYFKDNSIDLTLLNSSVTI
jgi:radical SAM superfamily enzyme YgiQ (UPF0313 family)